MAMPNSGKCYAVIVPIFLVLLVGLLYTGYAFRIRDHAAPASLDICASGRCSTPKRGFETVSTRGSFAKSKLQPPDEKDGLKKKDKLKLWSKLNKVEDVGDVDDDEGIDSDDEVVQIEVEDEDEMIVIDEREKLRQEEKKQREELEREEKERKEKEESERQLKEKEEQERKRKEEETRIREEENEKRRKREEEEQRKRDEERLRKEEEKRKKEEKERLRKEEAERRKKEEEERLKKEEAERRKKEEEERLKKEEEERRKKEEEERLKKEQEEQRKKEEEERLKKEQEEQRKKEEEERLKKEQEEQRKKEEEDRLRKQEEEEQRLQDEERKRREEAERLQEEEECRLREEDEERKKQEEERLRKEKEEQKRKEKEEAEKKRKEKEDLEAEKKRKEQENKKRVERLKKEAEEQKLRETEESKKRSKPKNNNDDDENGDDDDATHKSQKKIETVKVVDKKETKPKPKTDDSKSSSKLTSKKPSTAKPKVKRAADAASLSLAELNDMILSVPTFVPNFTAVEDPACQQHGKIFLRQLRGYKLWALQMLDSSAKIPSGLLRGNVNQLGDFDQCLEVLARVKIDEKTVKVQGKYCLASMDIYATHPAAKLPVNLMQGRALIRGNMRDPGHFVPKFTTINWALCLPAACSAKDARKSIENALESYNMTVGMKFMVDVDPDMCYVKQKVQSYSKETIGVLYFFAFIICLAIAATLRDHFATLQEKGSYSERIIMAFSLKRTVKALFTNKEISPSDIGCIHGIRSLATIALYAAHKLIPMSRMPYANRVSLTEIANHPISTILRSSLVYTDSFLLLSGVLTAYNMAKELENRGEIRWFCRLIARYVRLTPCLVAVVFWYAYVMEHIGSGPQWNAVVKSNADICKENSWINLLYVQNFFPFEEMCATHTHQLALDMQLFLIAPALVFFLQIKPIVGIIIVFFLLQVSATLRYLAMSNNNLSLVIFHGMTLKHLYKTANLTYALPLHRATPYLFGVSLGVLLHHTGKNVRIHKIFALLGWLIALALGSWSLFSPWRLAKRDYTYHVEEATYYAVVSPILTSLALCWTIFACFSNTRGIINRILSCYWMVILSKLSYAIYLSQFAVFFYNVGITRYSSDFQPLKTIDPHEGVIVISVSIVLTLLFDIPMQEVKNIIMECSDTLAEVEVEKSMENHVHREIRNNGHTIPQDVTPEDEEPTPRGWNWNHGTFTKVVRPESREYEDNGIEEYRSSRLKRQDIRRQSMIRSEAYGDDWENRNVSRRTSRSEDDGRTSRSDYRLSDTGLEDVPADGYLHPRERYYSGGYTRSPMRDLDAPVFRRSASRERPLSREQDIPREYARRPLITISKEEDYQSPRSPRSSMPRFNDQQRSLSSESEDPSSSRRSSGNYSRRLASEPRMADDDEYEKELHLRRNRFLQDRVSSQERDWIPPPVEEEENNRQWDSLKRRSSAEGKMALLKEPFRAGNMELWTVSKMALGSSQEPDEEDEEMYMQQRREYREQEPPLREEFEGEEEESSRRRSFASESLPTSFDEEEDTNSHELALKKDSRNLHITVQDLSKLLPEDDATVNNNWNKLDVKSGLFKRESIVKSQASEEDPEYLLPERPKLIEQEQEHPFKKAWQMQKSRSEEEGSTAFIIKDQRKPSPPLEKQKEEPEEKSENGKTGQDGEQGIEIPEADVACEVTLVWQPRNNDIEDTRSSTKSTSSASSAHINWPDEEEEFENFKNRRKSDEESWMWSEKD